MSAVSGTRARVVGVGRLPRARAAAARRRAGRRWRRSPRRRCWRCRATCWRGQQQSPPIFVLTAAIVGVRLFGLLRATARYAERLVAHDLALRRLGRMRVEAFARLVDLVPNALGPRTSTAVLDGVVADVERLQDLPVRVLVPGAALAAAAAACVGAAALMLPAAGLVLAVTLGVQASCWRVIARRDRRTLARAQAAAARGSRAEMVLVLDAAPELVAWGAAGRAGARVAEAGGGVDRSPAAARAGGAGGGATRRGRGRGRGGDARGDQRRRPPRDARTARWSRPWRCSRSRPPRRSARSAMSSSPGARSPSRRPASTSCSGADRARAARRPAADGGVSLRGARCDGAGAAAGRRRPRHRRRRARGAGRRVGRGQVGPRRGAGRLRRAGARRGHGRRRALGAVDGEALRRTVRWAPQDPHVFPTTLAANLRIAAPDAGDAALERALRAVGGGPVARRAARRPAHAARRAGRALLGWRAPARRAGARAAVRRVADRPRRARQPPAARRGARRAARGARRRPAARGAADHPPAGEARLAGRSVRMAAGRIAAAG